jgi:sigma-B regulation protein RsbU (phosphoserine phosphatase)
MSDKENEQEFGRLKEENLRLRMAVEELSILNEIATAISSTLDLDRVVDLIVQKCVKHLKVEQGAVWLLNDKEQGTPLHTMVRKLDSVASGLPFRLDAQVTGWMLKHQKPLVVNDFLNDDRFQITKNDNVSIRSLLAVPLTQKGKMIGILTVFNKRGAEQFTEDDRRLLTIIAAQSAQVIEGARLYLEEQQYLRMQQDMNLAKEIQLNLLPKEAPQIKGYDAFGISIPAKDVGGDYYDFIPIQDDKMAICLGDVSGKGMPAALLMANLQATLRGQTITSNCARECLERSNQLLYHSTDTEKYATLFYGILNIHENILCFSNAGHNNPFLISGDGKIQRLKTIGIPLGFLEKFEFSEHSVKLNEGDTLVLFSDGISEAMNSYEEEFEEERLLKVILESRHLSTHKLIDLIVKAVKEHAGDAPQTDDMTLLVVKRNS